MTATINQEGKAGLARRKSYAVQCLLSGRTYTRRFDNCFENGDGGEVVRYLMRLCGYATPEKIEWAEEKLKSGVIYGGKEWSEYKKIDKAQKLHDAIKRAGLWDSWSYYVKNGTYAGY